MLQVLREPLHIKWNKEHIGTDSAFLGNAQPLMLRFPKFRQQLFQTDKVQMRPS